MRKPILFTVLVSCLPIIGAAESLPPLQTTGQNQAGLTFSPDGQTAWWAAWNGVWGGDATSPRTLYRSRLSQGVWSTPEVAPFSGEYPDDDPFVSPDGQWLYFVSERPVDVGGSVTQGDIWRYHLAGELGLEHLSINSDAADYSPIITNSGALYFASAREGGQGRGDLYRAEAVEDDFGHPVNLGPVINQATGEWNLWVSPDETEMIFEASSRPGNVSIPGDLYYSRRSGEAWSEAMPLSELNSEGSDLLPRLHPDGLTLYYTTAPIGGHAQVVEVDWSDIKNRMSY